jgi:hypothetical protein
LILVKFWCTTLRAGTLSDGSAGEITPCSIMKSMPKRSVNLRVNPGVRNRLP